MKIRHKLTWFASMAVAIPLLCVAILSAAEILELSRALQAARFQSEMSHISGRISNFFGEIKANVHVLAANPDFAELDANVSTFMDDEPKLVDSENAGGIESLLFERFTTVRESRPEYIDVYFGTVLGGFIFTSKEMLNNYDPRMRPWYRRALENPDEVAISAAYIGTNGIAMVSIAHVVKGADGIMLGVQSVDVSLETLTRMIGETVLGERGYVLLINDDGVVLADPVHPEFVNRHIAGIGDPVFEQLKAANSYDFFAVDGAVSTEILKFHVPDLGWTLVGVVDSDELTGPATMLLNGFAGVGVVMLMVAIIISSIFATRIGSPVSRVAENMRELAHGRGDLSAKLDVPSDDEIGDLAKYFNQFLDTLSAQQGEQLRAQKMEAVGQLAAGIAHEINTPAQFIGDNVRFLDEAFTDVRQLIGAYQKLVEKSQTDGNHLDAINDIHAVEARIDLDFLLQEIPVSISQSADGISRVSTIIKAMKEFSHPGSDEPQPAQINRAIENTTIVARAEWKYCSELELILDPHLPAVSCSIGDINQAVLNIVVNAAHAIEERRQRDGVSELGKIKIETGLDGDYVFIAISDNGGGIPEAVREKIFDPFFTTKEVGKGTGQGLSIAYKAVVGKHGGKLDLSVEEGIGTTFRIMLPIGDWKLAADDESPASFAREPAANSEQLASIA